MICHLLSLVFVQWCGDGSGPVPHSPQPLLQMALVCPQASQQLSHGHSGGCQERRLRVRWCLLPFSTLSLSPRPVRSPTHLLCPPLPLPRHMIDGTQRQWRFPRSSAVSPSLLPSSSSSPGSQWPPAAANVSHRPHTGRKVRGDSLTTVYRRQESYIIDNETYG